MILPLALLLMGQTQAPPPQKELSVVLAASEERAEAFAKEVALRKPNAEEALKKGFLRDETDYAVVYFDEGLVEDDTISGIEKVVAQWLEGTLPANRYWSSLSREDKKLYGGLLAQGPVGRRVGGLENILKQPDVRFAFSVDLEVARKSGKPLVALAETEELQKIAGSPKADETLPDFEPGRAMSVRMSRGYPRKLETPTLSQALAILDKRREERLEKVRAKVDAEAWKRFQKTFAKPDGWDGRTPIRFGDLDPILKMRLLNNAMGEEIKDDEVVGPIRFQFCIGFAKDNNASVNGLFSAYR